MASFRCDRRRRGAARVQVASATAWLTSVSKETTEPPVPLHDAVASGGRRRPAAFCTGAPDLPRSGRSELQRVVVLDVHVPAIPGRLHVAAHCMQAIADDAGR